MKAMQVLFSIILILFSGFNVIRTIGSERPLYAILFTGLLVLGGVMMKVAIKELKEED